MGVPPVSWQYRGLLACFQCIRFAHSFFPSASFLVKFLLRSPSLVYRGIAAGEEIRLETEALSLQKLRETLAPLWGGVWFPRSWEKHGTKAIQTVTRRDQAALPTGLAPGPPSLCRQDPWLSEALKAQAQGPPLRAQPGSLANRGLHSCTGAGRAHRSLSTQAPMNEAPLARPVVPRLPAPPHGQLHTTDWAQTEPCYHQIGGDRPWADCAQPDVFRKPENSLPLNQS